ncbi:MAG: hypothetical protein IPK76_09560 [Lewinellaceae bacterium]|nr:hypothetical protein [Lewinellaceae bacterium]
MKTLLRISVLLAFSGALFGQKHDYIWTMGYGSNPFDTSFSGFNIDFNSNLLKSPKNIGTWIFISSALA